MNATIHVRSDDSAGAVGIVEVTAPPHWDGPRLHHHAFDEAFYVLEGRPTFQLGDEIVERGPGDVVFAPRDAIHTLANLGDEPIRYLLVCTPGGFERRFDPQDDRPAPETIFVGGLIRETLAGR
jgi:mannose-6-phosphate isomerase-like protein (cupin superfamily)